MLQEERGHARKFAEYVNQRGGKVTFSSIVAPAAAPTSALDSLMRALTMEKEILGKITALIKVADEHHDSQLEDFMVEMVEEQYESIKHLGELITKLQRVGGEGLGLYQFDKDLCS